MLIPQKPQKLTCHETILDPNRSLVTTHRLPKDSVRDSELGRSLLLVQWHSENKTRENLLSQHQPACSACSRRRGEPGCCFRDHLDHLASSRHLRWWRCGGSFATITMATTGLFLGCKSTSDLQPHPHKPKGVSGITHTRVRVNTHTHTHGCEKHEREGARAHRRTCAQTYTTATNNWIL